MTASNRPYNHAELASYFQRIDLPLGPDPLEFVKTQMTSEELQNGESVSPLLLQGLESLIRAHLIHIPFENTFM